MSRKPSRWLWVIGLLSVAWTAGRIAASLQAAPAPVHAMAQQPGPQPVASERRTPAPSRTPDRPLRPPTQPIAHPPGADASIPATQDEAPASARALAPGEDALQAAIPDLDLALDIEDRDEARERTLVRDAQVLLAEEPTVGDVSARCGTTFCRLRIDRTTAAEWERIDMTLRPIMIGEMIFSTEHAEDGSSFAFVYISEPSSVLPLAVPEEVEPDTPRAAGG